MRSLDVANILIEDYGAVLGITNLKLNKLVYFAQVEGIRRGMALFDDPIEAWEYGPVAPMVYQTFKEYGRRVIHSPSEPPRRTAFAEEAVREVAETYGRLSAFDLVTVSHRQGGAWDAVYVPGFNNEIEESDIVASSDIDGFASIGETFSQKVDSVVAALPNALRLLQNA